MSKYTWKYNGEVVDNINDVPEGSLGFIYQIKNLTNGKYYIGRKEFFSNTNPEVSKAVYDREKKLDSKSVTRTKNKAKSKKAGKTIWRFKRKVNKETNWKTYNSSSVDLKEDIKKGDTIGKEILYYCKSKTELTYLETKSILCSGCFEDKYCYNHWISAKIRKEFLDG